MFKPLELFVGLRYTRSKHKNNFISFISLASMLGILFGVLVLITVLSVMNGFEKELKGRILSMVSHVTVSGTDGGSDELLSDWRVAQERIVKHPSVQGSAPFIQQQVMLSANGVPRGALVQGVLPNEQVKVADIAKQVIDGNFNELQPRSYGISLGAGLAQQLGVIVGDKVTVITSQIRVTPAGMIPRMKRFTVSSVFQVNMAEYDNFAAFIHMRDASKLFKTRDQVTGLRVKVDDSFKAKKIAGELQTILGNEFKAEDWGVLHKSLFDVMKTDRLVMFFFLFLIVLVAVFNLISTLVMVVNDKQADIAILRTQGMSASQIKRVFMVQGTIIGFIGAFLGTVFGVLLASNVEVIIASIESLIGVQLMPAEIFYTDSRIPSVVDSVQVLGIAVLAFVLAILATIYPASRASKVQPAESLRYE